MRTLLGIDIGTSSIKAMMLDIASGKIYVKKRRYSVSIPAPNCAEQWKFFKSFVPIQDAGKHLNLWWESAFQDKCMD